MAVMQALSSYNPDFHARVASAVEALHGPSEGLEAVVYFLKDGAFARFDWPDWPEEVRNKLSARVETFRQEHLELDPVPDGTPEWQFSFGNRRSDHVSALVIAETFRKYFDGRVQWVKSERDTRGRIFAQCMVRDLVSIPPTNSTILRIPRRQLATELRSSRGCRLSFSGGIRRPFRRALFRKPTARLYKPVCVKSLNGLAVESGPCLTLFMTG